VCPLLIPILLSLFKRYNLLLILIIVPLRLVYNIYISSSNLRYRGYRDSF